MAERYASLSLLFAPQAVARINRLQELTGAKSPTIVIRHALATHDYIHTQFGLGNKILIREADGTMRELVPEFPAEDISWGRRETLQPASPRLSAPLLFAMAGVLLVTILLADRLLRAIGW